MELLALASLCTAGQCPTVWTDAVGRLFVQGDAETQGWDLPEGESRVRIPRMLLAEAVTAMGDRKQD